MTNIVRIMTLSLVGLLTSCQGHGEPLYGLSAGNRGEAPVMERNPVQTAVEPYRASQRIQVYDCRELMYLLGTDDEMVVINWLYTIDQDLDQEIRNYEGLLVVPDE